MEKSAFSNEISLAGLLFEKFENLITISLPRNERIQAFIYTNDSFQIKCYYYKFRRKTVSRVWLLNRNKIIFQEF